MIGLLNLLPAYNYVYPTYSYSEIRGVIQRLSNLETIANLVFPVVITFLLALLIFVRFFQFLLLLYQSLVRLTHMFSKHEGYETLNYDDDSFYEED